MEGPAYTPEYRMREYGVFLLKKSGKTVYRKKRENERIRFREYAPDADFAA